MSTAARTAAKRVLRGERFFRWRGGDVSRVEALADAVIALSMTLVIVSLEVPETFSDLLHTFKQLPAFAVCFAMLVLIWYYHYQFHRRFGLENLYSVFLNAALLFLILFYVYPLKFLFTGLFDFFLGAGRPRDITGPTLMVLYSGGVVGIFGLFTLMNVHAYGLRDELELTDVEKQVTIGTIREHLIHVGFGVSSILLALFVNVPLAGMIYFLVGPMQFINGYMNGRKVERLAARLANES